MKNRKKVITPGALIRELRRQCNWTQAELAEVVGMAVSNLSNIERGRSRIGEDRAILFAAAFDLPPAVILFPKGFEREDLSKRVGNIKKAAKSLKTKKAKAQRLAQPKRRSKKRVRVKKSRTPKTRHANREAA